MSWLSTFKKLSLLGGSDDDPDKWPSMGDEAREMLEAAILMYAFADLRSLARNGKLSSAEEKLLTMPVCVLDVISAVQDNMENLKKEISDPDLYLTSLSSMKRTLQKHNRDVELSGEDAFNASRLVIFDDENCSSELVYGIAVNTARRRISVGFRGSVTLNDFIVDAKAVLVEIDNPIKDLKSRVYVHHGFREYMLGASKQKKSSVDCFPNKYEQIMSQLVPLLAQYPNYRLYVTGHSLGGALATLFAFYAAVDKRIPAKTIVTCVSIASPKVGSLSFRRAFQYLEETGRLRCLRVANHRDLVTLVPDRASWSFLYLVFCQSYVYRHVGVGLKLYGGRSYKITTNSKSRWYLTILFLDWVKQVRHYVVLVLTLPFLCCCGNADFLKYHGCREYMQRLLSISNDLKRVELNTYYKKERNCCY